jgi:class 3 adenylate cyclase
MRNTLVRKVKPAGNSLTHRVNPGKKVMVRRAAPARQSVVMHRQATGIKFRNVDIADKFNPAMLDLGNLNTPCEEKNAIAAVFDLTDFTRFCNQVDAYLEIPRFLNYFLKWFFNCIIQGFTEENDGEKSTFWAELPMLVKFMGDGLLIVWDTQRIAPQLDCRLVATLYNICRAFNNDFYPQVNNIINKPPSVLRCGVARGRVFSIGNGRDYVGHCINNASRLSHLDGLTFAFPHRGFNVRDDMPEDYARRFIPKFIAIKGVGENEMVWVLKNEYNNLPEERKIQFRDFDAALASAGNNR